MDTGFICLRDTKAGLTSVIGRVATKFAGVVASATMQSSVPAAGNEASTILGASSVDLQLYISAYLGLMPSRDIVLETSRYKQAMSWQGVRLNV